MRCALPLLLSLALAAPVSACEAPADVAQTVDELYGESIAFDVYRNDKRVGEHRSRFRRDGAVVDVHSTMQLAIKLLFVTVYEFAYESRSRWCGGRLETLEASTTDGGDTTRVKALARGGKLLISGAGGTTDAPADLMTSDHWNAAILQRDALLNTISGKLNRITISPCIDASPRVTAAAPGASCYQYSGDLETRVWYDPRGRWSGLEFSGRDGSTIVYVCRQCGGTAM